MKRRGRTTGADNEAPPTGPIVLDLHGTPIPHAYQQYTVSFVATSPASFISFAFRNDPAFLGLDDVSVTTGAGPNLIVNGDFELGVIEDVKEVGRKPGCKPLSDVEVFVESHIGIPQAGAAVKTLGIGIEKV
jgi:hypothetical protein